MPQPPDAPPPVARLLTDADLADPRRFVHVPNVPILDAHRSEAKGDVGPDLLALMAKNSNARASRGDYAPVMLGHTRDDDESEDGFIEEHKQPEPVGYARNFRVSEYQGRPCMYADFHIHMGDYHKLPKYPHRSVERYKGPSPDHHWIDAVGLLRKASDRDLGKLSYERALPEGASLVHYCRGLDCGCVPGRPSDGDYDLYAREVRAGLAAPAAARERYARADLLRRLTRLTRPGGRR